MKKRFLSTISLLIVLSLITPTALAQDIDGFDPPAGDLAEHVPGELLIQFSPGVNSAQAEDHMSEMGVTHKKEITAIGVHLVELPPGLSVEQAIDRFSSRPGVEFAEPNYIYQLAATTPVEVDDQWGLLQIKADQAWGVLPPEQRKPILLATVDTGIDRFHNDLSANIWENSLEVNGEDNVDDDNNGFVDDTWGWDFANTDNDPFDDNMHGTGVSSVMVGVQDGAGVAGVCPWCQVMAVKVLTAEGSGSLAVVAEGINYAAQNGARVINLSLRGPHGDTMEAAVNNAWNLGAVVVAAAGNDGANAIYYPSGYANAMGVASTDENDRHSCFSNYYEDSISVSAPGEGIWMAEPNQEYGRWSGTSLSAPHVSGLAGLLFSQDESRENIDVRPLIEATADDLGPLGVDAFFGHGRINAYRALGYGPPSAIPEEGLFSTSDTASGYAHARKLVRDGSDTLHMIWHTKEGSSYQIKYAFSQDDGANWILDPEMKVVYSSPNETYHSALATDGTYLYAAIPSKTGPEANAFYQILFTRKLLPDGNWEAAVPIMGGDFNTVRPDMYFDPTNDRLHVIASSLDDSPNLYYRAYDTLTETWINWGGDELRTFSPSDANTNTRYATLHANGPNIYVVTRTITNFANILYYYYMYTTHSADGGANWVDKTQISSYMAVTSAEYGISLSGVGDRMYMGYEVGGNMYFRRNDGDGWGGLNDSYLELELGYSETDPADPLNQIVYSYKWPTITQAEDGRAWLIYEEHRQSIYGLQKKQYMQLYDGSTWTKEEESLGSGTYANFKNGTSTGTVEWLQTACNGSPFVVEYNSRSVGTNTPPVAHDQDVTTDEDTQVNITLTGSDAESPSLSFSVVTGPSHGSLSGTEPDLTYTPDPDYNGLESFTFVTNDGIEDSPPGTVSITVNPVNDAPDAKDDSASTPENTSVDIDVAANDTDVDGNLDPATTSIVNGPLHGTLDNHGDGTFTFTPDTDYSGSDSFDYQICDNGTPSLCDSALVSITVTYVNNPPVAVDDNDSVAEGGTLNATAPGILGNDSDPDNDDLTVTTTAVSLPTHGSLTLNANGSYSYSHDGSETTSDSFEYEVCDDGTPKLCDTASVAITVLAVNDPPVGVDDTGVVTEEGALNVFSPGVLGNDSDVENDSLTVTTIPVSWPAHGSLTLNADGSYLYSHDGSETNSDSFEYEVCDDGTPSLCDTATVAITVLAVNDPPLAVNDTGSLDEGGTLDVTPPGVLGNDSDPEGDSLSVDPTPVSLPTNGSLTLNSDGSYTYIHNGSKTTSDSFVYKVCDSGTPSLCDTALVSLTITLIDSPPVANDDNVITAEDTPVAITLTGSDPDGDDITYRIYSYPSHGALSGSAPDVTYTPNSGYAGTDSFTFVVNDGQNDSLPGVVSITITSSTMHVGDLDPKVTLLPRNRWDATVIITIHDAAHDPITLATVNGSWSEGASGDISCITGLNGTCEVTKNNLKGNLSSVKFTVNSVSHSSLAYSSSNNHDPDTDSSGTTITVYKAGAPANQPPEASFTYNCTDLTCDFDASGSYDPEGPITSYSWSFGDGNTGNGMTPSHDYSDQGIYTVELTVYDQDGASSSDSQQVFLGDVQVLHVGDLDGEASFGKRNRWDAFVDINVHGENEEPVQDVTVFGSWSANESGSCTTNAEGWCTISLMNIKQNVNSVNFSITNLSKVGWEYNLLVNHDPDPDDNSNGTSIAISSP